MPSTIDETLQGVLLATLIQEDKARSTKITLNNTCKLDTGLEDNQSYLYARYDCDLGSGIVKKILS
jgi:hypothetical protein